MDRIDNALTLAGNVVLFVVSNIIGWVTYVVYKLGMWLADVLKLKTIVKYFSVCRAKPPTWFVEY